MNHRTTKQHQTVVHLKYVVGCRLYSSIGTDEGRGDLVIATVKVHKFMDPHRMSNRKHILGKGDNWQIKLNIIWDTSAQI